MNLTQKDRAQANLDITKSGVINKGKVRRIRKALVKQYKKDMGL